MSIRATLERYTIDDYDHWHDDWELIDGIPLALTPSPGIAHQRANRRIVRQLDEALDECPGCEVLFKTDVEFSRDTVTRPDTIVICFEPDGERITRAPELIFEIVSPRTVRRDEQTKRRLYRKQGVGHYVVVYPELRTAKVYRLTEGRYRKLGELRQQRHRFELSRCSIDFDFARLWPD